MPPPLAKSSGVVDQLAGGKIGLEYFYLACIVGADTILSIPAGSQHFESEHPRGHTTSQVRHMVDAGNSRATWQDVRDRRGSIRTPRIAAGTVLTGFFLYEDVPGVGMGLSSSWCAPSPGYRRTQARHVGPK